MRYLVAILLLLSPCSARDLGQWENHSPVVREWFKTLMRPDFPTLSCCGEADGYWCDDIHVKDGHTFCTITDDRDDGPLMRDHVPIGTVIEIPNEKLKWDAGNPTGHAILFYGPRSSTVFCFVQGGGT